MATSGRSAFSLGRLHRMRAPSWLTARPLFGRAHERDTNRLMFGAPPLPNNNINKEVAAEPDALRHAYNSTLAKLEEVAELVRGRSEGTTYTSKRLALLIDADNTSWKVLDLVMEEVSRHGDATTRRGYGDFTTNTLAPWKEPMAKHAIMPTQVYQHTSNKNSTDSRMIIDAVELLHSGRFDVFCLVSSDADFTSLAMRIREQGTLVIGIGRAKSLSSARSFVAACNTFVEIETLERTTSPSPGFLQTIGGHSLPASLSGSPWTQAQTKQLGLLKEIVMKRAQNDGWACMGEVGQAFDARKLGASSAKLSKLFASLSTYEVTTRHGGTSWWVKLK